jgi:hypothetical protein
MHLSDQEIRTYFADDESTADAVRISNHLVECTKCQGLADQLALSGVQTSQHMSVLTPQSDELPQPTRQAILRFEQRYFEKENSSMFDRLFNRKYRFTWAAVGVVAVLAIAMLFPQVRAIGSSFLGLFRVEQFTIIQVDPEKIGEQLSSSSNFEFLLAEDVEFEEFGEMQDVSGKAEASDLAGFSVRLPSAGPANEKLIVQPGARISMLVDLPKVQALLDELGIADLKLPAVLDGAEVSMELPVAVAAGYGTCEVTPEMVREAGVDPDRLTVDLSECVTLIQFPSPEISAPPGLDIARIGQGFLQVLGMTPEEAAQFSQNVDWTTTLVIPIPRYGTEYQEILVDGVEGTLIMQSEHTEFPHYMLVWIKDGIVYALTGPGDAQSALELANSLE